VLQPISDSHRDPALPSFHSGGAGHLLLDWLGRSEIPAIGARILHSRKNIPISRINPINQIGPPIEKIFLISGNIFEGFIIQFF
jgi:hypothetical protein